MIIMWLEQEVVYRQKGNIDEFKVYDYALDGAQVRKTYRNYINIVDKTELEELY